jgi:hypothetical protein
MVELDPNRLDDRDLLDNWAISLEIFIDRRFARCLARTARSCCDANAR